MLISMASLAQSTTLHCLSEIFRSSQAKIFRILPSGLPVKVTFLLQIDQTDCAHALNSVFAHEVFLIFLLSLPKVRDSHPSDSPNKKLFHFLALLLGFPQMCLLLTTQQFYRVTQKLKGSLCLGKAEILSTATYFIEFTYPYSILHFQHESGI